MIPLLRLPQGGVTTLFNIPNFRLFNGSNFGDWPFLDPLKDFKYQAAGDKVLADGTRFGVLHIAARDVDGKHYGEPGKKGIEIKSFVWYGDGAKDEFLEHERQHMVIETIRLSIVAQKNLKDGQFKVPPEPKSG
ncbi:uncharacterized protein EI97DRAFT_436024 [Westerdykella ornata]|uniref:Uncharacterized protein n=1 Tax=Westerdykella ornata TaxID=318751 RepID=A0A6A6JBG5_WESOR|nr:uncharacterized protein EI97DRAFT_436024 [Westerdykella ornata]KAF2273607.1 hypothetical protein EI97DRAFT_436024 [Westerdykella ornata]